MRRSGVGSIADLMLFVFPFAVIFLFVPTELYYHNLSDWGGDAFLLKVLGGAGLAAALIVGLLVLCLRAVFVFSIEKVCFWFFVAGIYFLFSDVFAPLQLARLDGATKLSDEPLLYTVIEALLLLAVIFFACQFKTEGHRKICGIVALVLVVCFSGYFTFAIKAVISKGQQPALVVTSPVESARLPNIYHIVLDEMETDYFLALLNDPARKASLKGFSLFKNNVSNYPYTDVSAASYLTGTGYYSGSYSKWIAESDNSMLNLASRNGYSVNVYGKPSLIHASSASTYTAQDEVLKRFSGMKHPLIKEFSRLWFARVSPNFMTNAALEYGSALGEVVSEGVDASMRFQPKTIEEGVEPYAGTFMFDDAIETEKSRPDASSYLYLHVLLPHGPYVLDEQCNYDPVDGDIAAIYLRQAQCALSKLDEFLAELDRLGRLDNSVVIVQSDHGAGWAGFLEGSKLQGYHSSVDDQAENVPFDATITPWSKEQLESRSMALLMIKPAHSTKGFSVVEGNSQLLDVYPTIAALAGIDVSSIRFDGQSLVNCLSVQPCDIPEGRARYFNFFSMDGIVAGDYYKFKVGISEQGRPQFDSVERAKIKVSDFESGSVISFSQAGYADDYIGHGWSGQEADHRWTDGPRAEIRLPMKLSSGKNDLLLRVKAGGYPAPGGHQQVDVIVNGTRVASWTLSGLGGYEAIIPNSVVGDGVLDIVFKIKTPTAPCDVSESQDCRKLGMAVAELSVIEQGATR